MNFNSAGFALFIAIVAILYLVTQWARRDDNPRLQNSILLIASYWFYGSWDHRFLFLILLSTGLDYTCGLGMTNRKPGGRVTFGMFASLLLGGVLLCAPINWEFLWLAALPADAFTGGWALLAPTTSFLVADPDWKLLIGSFGAVALLAVSSQVGFRLTGRARRRFFLFLSIVGNVGLLGFFKYFDFFVDGASEMLSAFGMGEQDWRLGVIVPVGISFYTFQTLSYTIDIYREELEPTENLTDFALFVAFFPQLVAGPIERAKVLLPQLQKVRHPSWGQIQSGAYLIGWGLFKKIFIADNLARLVTVAYAPGAEVTGPEVVFATYAFAFQIYCDFSGYSDIARGISRTMGIELMVNFNVPYCATNPREFWRRWHISLSTWLRDYLYFTFGGNRGSAWFNYRNLMLTMVLGGLWHGARANFVWWGLYQGGLLCLHRLIEPRLRQIEPDHPALNRIWRIVCWFVFMQMVCYGWLLFRVDSNAQLWDMTVSILSGWQDVGDHVGILARILWFTWLLLVVQVFQVRSENLLAPLTWTWPVRLAFYVTLFYLTVIFGAFDVIEFIYFQF